ncbi:unnamed protein product [Gordionus sp. m RMFG-2023]
MPAKNKTFKFESFSSQICKIKVDILNQPRNVTELDEYDSYFTESLENWVELNCTFHFTNFYYEVRNYSSSFVHIVHHQKTIIQILIKHLSVEGSMALEPLLDLLIQLARDLQTDFYPYFYIFFDVMVKLLKSQLHYNAGICVDHLKFLFSTLSYLIKYLWRYLVKDIIELYNYYILLFDKDQNVNITRFAAESFTYLARKVKFPRELINHMHNKAFENEKNLHQGTAMIISETIKGVNGDIHTKGLQFIKVLLETLNAPEDKVEKQGCVFDIVYATFDNLKSYLTRNNFHHLATIFLKISVHNYRCSLP